MAKQYTDIIDTWTVILGPWEGKANGKPFKLKIFPQCSSLAFQIEDLCDWGFHNTLEWNPKTKHLTLIRNNGQRYEGTLHDGVFTGICVDTYCAWSMERPKPPIVVPFRGFWKGSVNQRFASQGHCNQITTFVSDLPIFRNPDACYDIKLRVTDWNQRYGTFIEADVGLCDLNSKCPPSGSWCTDHTDMSFRMMNWNLKSNLKSQLIGPDETLQILINFKSNLVQFVHKNEVIKQVEITGDIFELTLTLWSQGAVEIIH